MMNEVGVVTAKKQPLLPRWLKFLLILVGTLLFLAAGAWVLLDIVTRQDLRAALAEVEALGWPLTLQELYPEAIPDSENAALMYQQASWALQPETELVSRVGNLEDWRALAEEEQARVREALAKNDQALGLLHQAAQMERCQFDLEYRDSYAMELPHVAQLRSFTRWKRTESIMALADGRSDEALEHWLDSLAMVRHQEGQKVLISELVRLACLSISVDALEAFVQSGQFSESQLERALVALEGIEARESFADGLKGEVAFTMDIFARALEDAARDMGFQSGDLEQALFSLYSSPLARPWRQYDQATYVSMHRDLVELGEQPYSQAHQQLKQWENKLERLVASPARPVITCMLLPALSRVWKALARGEARVALARTALALERYRLTHGEYPRALTDLTPDLLPDVPIDPFDGQPLRYVNSDERVAVYSIGEDLQDGGGSAEPDTYGDLPDIVFTLRRAPTPTEGPDDE